MFNCWKSLPDFLCPVKYLLWLGAVLNNLIVAYDLCDVNVCGPEHVIYMDKTRSHANRALSLTEGPLSWPPD